LSARVYAGNTGMKWVGAVPGRVFSVRGYEVSDELVVSLTDSQLLALDAERHGHYLELIINLVGTMIHVAPGVYPSSETQLTLFIQAETWLKNLDQVGSELEIIIRVPSPLTDPGAVPPPTSRPGDPALASRAQAVARLRQARGEIRSGQYENSVATCRLVLDSLGLLGPMPSAKTVSTRSHRIAPKTSVGRPSCTTFTV
jgi:hypothetical protein